MIGFFVENIKMSAKFGYWNIRGVILMKNNCRMFIVAFKLAQPIRLLLAYTGTDYEETRYGSPEGRCKSTIIIVFVM